PDARLPWPLSPPQAVNTALMTRQVTASATARPNLSSLTDLAFFCAVLRRIAEPIPRAPDVSPGAGCQVAPKVRVDSRRNRSFVGRDVGTGRRIRGIHAIGGEAQALVGSHGRDVVRLYVEQHGGCGGPGQPPRQRRHTDRRQYLAEAAPLR